MTNIERIKQKNQLEIEKEENEKIARKIDSFNIHLGQLHITQNDVLNLYEGMYFRDTTIPKKEVFYQVLTNTLTKDNKDFLTICGDKVNSHQKDKRTASGYAIDLIIGWLIEDAILASLLLRGIPVKLQGSDNQRDFLNQNELETTPDLLIENTQIEIVSDWTDYWMRTGNADLRDNKFKKLVQEEAYLFGMSPISGMGFLIKVSDNTHGFEYNPRIYGFGGKPGYTTSKIKDHMKPINDVINDLCEIFSRK